MSENVTPINEAVEKVLQLQKELRSGSGGGNSGDLERRIGRLESQFDTLAKDMSEVKATVRGIEKTLIERPNLTKWDVFQVLIVVNGVLIAFGTFLLRFSLPPAQ